MPLWNWWYFSARLKGSLSESCQTRKGCQTTKGLFLLQIKYAQARKFCQGALYVDQGKTAYGKDLSPTGTSAVEDHHWVGQMQAEKLSSMLGCCAEQASI